MRIIDKTPFLSEDGSISIVDRIKGTLQNGFSWYPDLQAQQAAIKTLEKHLDKKFTLIRNHTLGNSKITVPMILIGPPGITMLHVTHLQGMYRAKGDEWGTVDGGKFKPASINLLTRTAKLARALQVYLKQLNIDITQEVEPILLAIEPGMHVASVRPIVRIVMSDAIDRFATSLSQDTPALSFERVHEIADLIVNPRKPKLEQVKEAPAQPEADFPIYTPQQNAPSAESQKADAFSSADMGELGFAFEDEDSATAPAAPVSAPRPSRAPAPKKAPSGYFGMSGKQLAVLAVLGAILACILIIFIFIILFTL